MLRYWLLCTTVIFSLIACENPSDISRIDNQATSRLIAAKTEIKTEIKTETRTETRTEVKPEKKVLKELSLIEAAALARDGSVIIMKKGGGIGTGVVSKSKDRVFVWSASHVGLGHFNIREPRLEGETERPKTVIEVAVVKFTGEGFKIVKPKIKVLAFTEGRGEGEDLMLLEVLSHKEHFKTGIKFKKDGSPPIGSQVFLVGNFVSHNYPLAVTPGIVMAHSLKNDMDTMDLASTAVRGGASGGGMFLQSTGECIGIAVQKLATSPIRGMDMGLSPTMYVPVRSMINFAKRHELEIALAG